MKVRTLLLTALQAKRCAKSLFRLVAIIATTFSVGSHFAPSVRCAALPDFSSPSDGKDGSSESASVGIPGPLRSFLRMAGISQKVSNEDVIPLLARNVFALGYARGTRTEFLILLTRYVQQARELVALARPDGIIHVSTVYHSII